MGQASSLPLAQRAKSAVTDFGLTPESRLEARSTKDGVPLVKQSSYTGVLPPVAP